MICIPVQLNLANNDTILSSFIAWYFNDFSLLYFTTNSSCSNLFHLQKKKNKNEIVPETFSYNYSTNELTTDTLKKVKCWQDQWIE